MMFVRIKRVNVRNFIPSTNTANFEVVYEDVNKKDSFIENLQVDSRAVAAMLRKLIEIEERANYDKETGTVRIVIEDKEIVKEKLRNFINEIISNASQLKSTAPERYLDTISRIDKMSLVF